VPTPFVQSRSPFVAATLLVPLLRQVVPTKTLAADSH
jgi:hypothetical protein